jgi:hypothetical protein
MTNAVYPTGILPWTDRLDDVDDVLAIDPNTLAAEVEAVERVLGALPYTEKVPPSGQPIQYATVDARLSALANNSNAPLSEVTSASTTVPNWQGVGTNFGQWNVYTAAYDPFSFFNGSDITIPDNGWYRVIAGQTWSWWSIGYNLLSIYSGATLLQQSKWDWDFTGNVPTGQWQGGNGTHRDGDTHVSWEGRLYAGSRIRVLSENGTSNPVQPVSNLWLKVAFVATIPPAV